MKKIPLILVVFYFLSIQAAAQKVLGLVTDSAGAPLSYSTIQVRGKGMGTTANAEGMFSLTLSKGTYQILCQHVGYQSQEKEIVIGGEDVRLHFRLKQQQLTLSEVIVTKGEDPAYEIIRNTIKRRSEFKDELKRFTTEVYTKGQFRLRSYPKSFMGQKVDFGDGDTSKNKFLFLSETVARYSVEKPDKSKVEVLASRVSGESDGFGMSVPYIISFYENNLSFGKGLNPRGFISPVGENALNFYRYKYEGDFVEEGKMISRVQVIPKRKFEPLFSGYINIVQDDWHIQSLQLLLTKDYGMQTIDTLIIEQLYTPVAGNKWVIKNQTIYPAARMFGFDGFGSFVNVYSNYNLNPTFPKDYFDNVVMKYEEGSNKKTFDFWNETRPIILKQEEEDDYRKKDSLEILRSAPGYLDSVDRERNKITASKVFLTGITHYNRKNRTTVSFAPLIQTLKYNTVEGFVLDLNATLTKRLDTADEGRKAFSLHPQLRYGFSNQHFNPALDATYAFGKKLPNSISIGGGSDVFQFNNNNPMSEAANTITTLLYERNILKIYEAQFVRASFTKGLASGLSATVNANYQARMPLENTSDFKITDKKKLEYTPNYPIPLDTTNIPRHEAFIVSTGIRFQPGIKYIEFPGSRMSLGSKYPVFTASYTQALKNVFSSDVGYSRWNFGVSDNLNLKLAGSFNYQLDFGGFIKKDSLESPDYIHFRGNEFQVTGSYTGRFQLVPHYYFSHASSFYNAVYIKHHFNGFITNKIPGLKQWKWNLVAGLNALYIHDKTVYLEPSIGLENIFKVLRVDYFYGIERNAPARSALRFGLQNAFSGLR